MSTLEILFFFIVIIAVIGLGIWMSRGEKGSEDYFLAGRGLSWWLIGFSLIAANISTEQFVGMSGQAADYVGLAIASYEWMAAITLVVVGFVFVPLFLRTGIYTIPEYLKFRYNELSRTIMAVFTMIIYVFVTITAVIYSGALVIDTNIEWTNVAGAAWFIGILAAGYVMFGGLKACAWTDLVWGSLLIVGGGVITFLAFSALGEAPVAELTHSAGNLGDLADDASGVKKFFALNDDKLHMVLPASDTILPWTALVVGLWIPNFYYWGLNQYITQRTLGSRSLAEAQKGIVFAAGLKLIIPFVIVFPGIMAFNLFADEMAEEARQDTQIQANWQLYESVRDTPYEAEAYYFFELNDAYALNHPERALEIQRYNEAAAEAADGAGVEPERKKLLGYKHDTAFGILVDRLVPSGFLTVIIFAALAGAVISSLASMLNAASTIFTMDLYKKFLHKDASDDVLVIVGRACVAVFVVIGALIAPLLANPRFGGIFTYIQEFQGFISPGFLGVFVFGLVVRRAPGLCGPAGLLASPAVYGLLKIALPGMAFLDRMAWTFACVLLVMTLITLIKPLKEPFRLQTQGVVALDSSRGAKMFGIGVVVMTVVLYIIFW